MQRVQAVLVTPLGDISSVLDWTNSEVLPNFSKRHTHILCVFLNPYLQLNCMCKRIIRSQALSTHFGTLIIGVNSRGHLSALYDVTTMVL